jgi:hypothetical protein
MRASLTASEGLPWLACAAAASHLGAIIPSRLVRVRAVQTGGPRLPFTLGASHDLPTCLVRRRRGRTMTICRAQTKRYETSMAAQHRVKGTTREGRDECGLTGNVPSDADSALEPHGGIVFLPHVRQVPDLQ